MNKQEAISKTSVLEQSVKYYHEQLIDCGNQILECKAIIDAPEPKTGRVMSVDDLEFTSSTYYFIVIGGELKTTTYDGLPCQLNCILAGQWFYDRASCEKYIEYLNLEQELRVAQIADGGVGCFVVIMDCNGDLEAKVNYNFQKVSFKTRESRDRFVNMYRNDQISLLIKGI